MSAVTTVSPQGSPGLGNRHPRRLAHLDGARAGHERLTELVEGALSAANRQMLAHFHKLKQSMNWKVIFQKFEQLPMISS